MMRVEVTDLDDLNLTETEARKFLEGRVLTGLETFIRVGPGDVLYQTLLDRRWIDEYDTDEVFLVRVIVSW